MGVGCELHVCQSTMAVFQERDESREACHRMGIIELRKPASQRLRFGNEFLPRVKPVWCRVDAVDGIKHHGYVADPVSGID